MHFVNHALLGFHCTTICIQPTNRNWQPAPNDRVIVTIGFIASSSLIFSLKKQSGRHPYCAASALAASRRRRALTSI
jgi:hypothetical protein